MLQCKAALWPWLAVWQCGLRSSAHAEVKLGVPGPRKEDLPVTRAGPLEAPGRGRGDKSPRGPVFGHPLSSTSGSDEGLKTAKSNPTMSTFETTIARKPMIEENGDARRRGIWRWVWVSGRLEISPVGRYRNPGNLDIPPGPHTYTLLAKRLQR